MKLFTFEQYSKFLDEGIYVKNNRIVIDIKSNPNDVVSLELPKNISNQLTNTNFIFPYLYLYLYKILKPNNKNDRDKVYDYLKNCRDEETIKNLINRGMVNLNHLMKTKLKIDNIKNLQSFDYIIYPKSSSRLNIMIVDELKRRSPHATILTDAIVKRQGFEIELNHEAVNRLRDGSKIKNQLIELITIAQDDDKSVILHNLKVPGMRTLISKNLKINPKFREFFKYSIDGKNILLVDDIISGGNTIREILRILEDHNPNYVLNVALLNNR